MHHWYTMGKSEEGFVSGEEEMVLDWKGQICVSQGTWQTEGPTGKMWWG